jgi:hypothetical protein
MICSSLVVVASVLLLVAAEPEKPNLLAASGFEEFAAGGALAEPWESGWYTTNEGAFGIDTSGAHTGQASFRCDITADNQFAHWMQQDIPIPEGASAVELSAWCKAQSVDDTFATIGVVFVNADGYWYKDRLWMVVAAENSGWRQYSGFAAVPKDAASMRVVGWANYQQRGTGSFWFDDLRLTVADSAPLPETVYRDAGSASEPTNAEAERGFILFSRDYTRVQFSQIVPHADERAVKLDIIAAQEEREPVVLSLHALRDLKDVSVSVGELRMGKAIIPDYAIEVRSVRYHPRDGEPRSGPFNETLIPDAALFLEQRAGVSVSANSTQAFWLTLEVPSGAAPGHYEGVVTVHEADVPVAKIPLHVWVRPFTLDPATGTTFAMYTRMRDSRAWMDEIFGNMRAHGLTSVAIMGASGLPFEMVDGSPVVQWTGDSRLEQTLDAYVQAGFPEPVDWLMGGDINAFAKKHGDWQSEEFAHCYREIVRQITERAKKVRWPEIIWQPLDEPFEHPDRLPETIQLLEILQSVPVRTEEDGMNGAWHRFTDRAYNATDVLVLHDGPVFTRGKLEMKRWEKFLERTRKDNKEIWFYNVDLSAWRPEPMRFMNGFGLWKSGATGIVEWSYMTQVNPDSPGDVYGRANNFFFRYPAAPGESGGPTIGYKGVSEGIDDYRYLVTLDNLVTEARASGEEDYMEFANAIWEPVQAKLDEATFGGSAGKAAQGRWTGPLAILDDGTRVVSGEHKINNKWEFEDYAELRETISKGIVRLKAAKPKD